MPFEYVYDGYRQCFAFYMINGGGLTHVKQHIIHTGDVRKWRVRVEGETGKGRGWNGVRGMKGLREIGRVSNEYSTS